MTPFVASPEQFASLQQQGNAKPEGFQFSPIGSQPRTFAFPIMPTSFSMQMPQVIAQTSPYPSFTNLFEIGKDDKEM